MSRKITTTVYITEEQQRLLKTLNMRSKVPVAEYIRQGIDMILRQNKDLLPGQMELEHLPPGFASDDGQLDEAAPIIGHQSTES